MGKYFKRKWISLVLAVVLLVLSGCGERAEQERENPSGDSREAVSGGIAGVLPEEAGGKGVVDGDKDTRETAAAGGDEKPGQETDAAMAITDFGVRLLQETIADADSAFPPYASMPEDVYRKIARGENILVSPLSVITALAMTGEGARGETLVQMEEAFGISVSELSAYLSVWLQALPAGEKYKLSMADSIWFTQDERFTVRQDFLDANEALFDAGIYRAPFDSSTVEEINRWVEENTDGMIREILDEIPPNAVMYLVNALAFDAEWQEIYKEHQVWENVFTSEDGTTQNVELMYSDENWYLEDENARGFVKYYSDEKYAFVALLPTEGMKVSEYIASLTGDGLHRMLTNPVQTQVNAAIPKFESEYSVEMSEILKKLGIEDAFSQTRADLSGIGSSTNGNLYINRVLHKTFIAVDEQGTKAGAATAVEITDEAAMIEGPDSKQVFLDRPFVYLIMDCETGIPVFIGTVMSVEEQ